MDDRECGYILMEHMDTEQDEHSVHKCLKPQQDEQGRASLCHPWDLQKAWSPNYLHYMHPNYLFHALSRLWFMDLHDESFFFAKVGMEARDT